MKGLMAAAFVALLVLAGCDGGEVALADRAGEPAAKNFSTDDPAMNAAMAEARRTVPGLIERLEALQEAGTSVSVKVPVGAQGEVEHIWLRNVSYRDGVFHGILDNVPVSLEGWAQGDPISVPADRISDWLVILDNRLYGGFTIHVHRAALSAEEQESFDASFGVTLPDRPQAL